MTSTNFIIANIKLLIEISDNGNYKIHEDRTHIDFNPCDELPPIRKNEDGDNIMQSIIDMVSSSTNKIKWVSDSITNNNIFVEENKEISNKEEEDKEEEKEEEEEEENEERKEEEEEKEEEEDKEKEDKEKEDKEKEEEEKEEEEEPRVYNYEINTKPKRNSFTTTLKNEYDKKHITRKRRLRV